MHGAMRSFFIHVCVDSNIEHKFERKSVPRRHVTDGHHACGKVYTMKDRVKNKICRFVGVLLTAVFLFPVHASALSFNSYPVDVDAIKALAETDTFEAKVTKKTVSDDVNNSGVAGTNPDMLTLTVETGTELEELHEAVIMVVCYDEEKMSQSLTGGGIMAVSIGESKRQITVLTFSDLKEKGGSTFQVNTPCYHGGFTGAQALVAQVKGLKGGQETELTNPIAADWQELALGSPTHILD